MTKPKEVFSQIFGTDDYSEIELSKNYRCPPNIVKHAKFLIENNQERIKKDMIAENKNGDANIRVISLPSAYHSLKVLTELISGIARDHPQHTVAIVGRKSRRHVFHIALLSGCRMSRWQGQGKAGCRR